MSIVTNSPYEIMLLGIPCPEHYVSIPITQSHVKRFSMLYTAIQLHFYVHVSVRFTIANHITIYVFYARMVILFSFIHYFHIILIVTFHVCIIDITEK